MNARENMLSDIIICAVEGGTGYWATADRYRHDANTYTPDAVPASVLLEEMEGDARIELNVVAVENAMFRIAHDFAFEVNKAIRKAVIYALITNDAAEIDSDDADVIAQAACFGKIVYG